MIDFKTSESPKLEREYSIDPEMSFCSLCTNETSSFFDADNPCSKCEIIITQFEPKQEAKDKLLEFRQRTVVSENSINTNNSFEERELCNLCLLNSTCQHNFDFECQQIFNLFFFNKQ